MTEGSAVEVGIVGRDGFPESLHLLGPELGHSRCFMQVAGAGMRMDFDEFQQEFLKNSILHERVLRYVQYGTLVLGQLAACNRLHEVEERLARWLLMVQDKVEEPSLRLTQEFLAQMLGSRRSTVTVVAGTLQRAGLITYRRGNVQIVQRESLEKAACECYAISHKFLRNLYKELEPANHGSQFSD